MAGLLIGMTRVKKGSIEIAVEMMIQRNVDPSTACRRPQHRIGQLLLDSPAQSGGTVFHEQYVGDRQQLSVIQHSFYILHIGNIVLIV